MTDSSKTRQYLPLITLLIISGAMFAGHFGVGDVIFPVILGRKAAASWFPAALGYFLVNSIGALLAYIACAQQGQTLGGIAQRTLGKVAGGIYAAIPVAIEVLFILPRVASATHEMSIASFFPGVALWITLLVYFVLNWYLAFSRAKVVDRIGKILSPLLIAFIVVLLLRGIIAPNAAVPDGTMSGALGNGLLEGYNTMNAMAAFLFGGWILNELSRRGVENKGAQNRNLVMLGLLTAIALGLTSTGLVYLGASTGSLFPEAAIGALSVEVAAALLGFIGKIIFAILIFFACITTSASITSMAGDLLQEVTRGKIPYKLTTVVASVLGFVLGLVGLSRIVRYTIPWLMLIYPSVVVLILVSLSRPFFERFKPAITAAVITALVFAIGDFLSGLGFPKNPASAMVSQLPLGRQGFGWLIPTVVVMAVAMIITLAVRGGGRGKPASA